MAPSVCDLKCLFSMVGCSDFCYIRMSDGRQTQVVLLDDRRLDILIKPKLYAGELLDMVASHFSLKEKEYFGLAYVDDTGHYSWLQLERRVLEHDFLKKFAHGTLIIYFLVKYFVESITHLRDCSTVEAFYLQSRSLVYKGTIETTSDVSFYLAALVLQESYGNYIDDQTTKSHLKKLPVIPTKTLQDHPSLTVCEERIAEHYKALSGLSRGHAIVSYITKVESLATYGVHYFEVKDKAGIPWWLGISFKGISQYDYTDRTVPRKVFFWKHLENLYFRDRKFSIEVHGPRRTSVNRRTFGSGNITVHVWFAATSALTKCIWSMAIAQHQFYLDHKHSKSQSAVYQSLEEIAAELSRSVHSLSSSTSDSSLTKSTSSHSLPSVKFDCDINEVTRLETIEMLLSLKARKETLEEILSRKNEELKMLCLKEGELTGVLPPETPLVPRDKALSSGKVINNPFSLKSQIFWKAKTKQDEELARLEIEYEIQKKITCATHKLLNDAKKNTCRQRRMSYQQAQSKLKDLDEKIAFIRKQINSSIKANLKRTSEGELSEDNISHSTIEEEHLNEDSTIKPPEIDLSSPSEIIHNDTISNYTNGILPSPAVADSLSDYLSVNSFVQNSSSAPPSPSKSWTIQSQKSLSQPSSPPSSSSNRLSQSLEGQGYKPNTVYQTSTSYRSDQYPTLSTKISSNDSFETKNVDLDVTLKSPYQNKFESTLNLEGSNLYSVPTQRTSQAFDSQDDILAALPSNPQDLGLMSRHNSLDRNRCHAHQRYQNNTKSYVTSDPSCNSGFPSSVSFDEHLSYRLLTNGGSSANHQSCQYIPYHPHHFHHHRHHYTFSELAKILPKAKEAIANSSKTYSAANKLCKKENSTAALNSILLCPVQASSTIDQLDNLESDFLNESELLPSKDDKGLHSSSKVVHNPLKPPTIKLKNLTSSPSKKNKEWKETALDISISRRNCKPQEVMNPQLGINQFHPINHIVNVLPSSSSSFQNCRTSSTVLIEKQICQQKEVKVVTVGHFQPYREETKPYMLSDFYKYSTKNKKQQQLLSKNVKLKAANVKVPICEQPVLLENSATARNQSNNSASAAFPKSPEIACKIRKNRPAIRRRYDESKINTSSNSSLEEPRGSVADAFHEEMFAWYANQETGKKTTLV